MSKKYAVYEALYASRYVGEFEADSVEEAIEKAENQDEGCCGLCYQCAREIDMDPSGGEFEAELIEEINEQSTQLDTPETDNAAGS